MSGNGSEDQDGQRDRTGRDSGSRRTTGKGSSTDSQGGRGDSDGDGTDDFVDERDSPQAQDAQTTMDAIEDQLRQEREEEEGTTTATESGSEASAERTGEAGGDPGETTANSGTSGEPTESDIRTSYNPDEVPEIRQGTEFEEFTSEQMTNTAAHAIQENNINKRRFAEWNNFFDHMTEAELEEAASRAVTRDIEREGFGSNPLDYEDSEPEMTDKEADLGRLSQRNLSSLLTRIGRDDPDRQREAFNRLIDDAPSDKEKSIAELGAAWCPSAEVRREIYEEHNLESEASRPQKFKMQFSDDHEERAQTFISSYVGSTSSEATQVARSQLMQYGPNEDADISKFNNNVATESIEPTEEFRETIDRLREETARHIEEEHDGEITLMRGLKQPITANASAESWTTSYSTAEDFDGHAIMEAKFKPGHVIATNEIQQHYEWGYDKHGSEKEWTVLGGPIARNIPEEMQPGEFLEKTSDLDGEPPEI
jgi:hypothetical protein